MEVKVKLKILEVDGETTVVGAPDRELIVTSHDTWNDIPGCVVLTTPNGKSYTIDGQALRKAITRCLDIG